jgi:hypothetical protein
MKLSFALLALGLAVMPLSAQESPDSATLELGRQFTQWFFAGEDQKLWEKFGPQMKEAMGAVANLPGFRDQVATQLGEETAVTEETTMEAQGYKIYLRTSTYSKMDGPILTQWTIAEDGTIGGFFIRPKPVGEF